MPSGRIHAIDAGNLILEIQQNSDTTYRVYDWGRVGLDGQPRQLHVKESMASIDFKDFEPELVHAEGARQMLAQSEEFTLRRIHLRAAETLAFLPDEQPRILSVVSGSLSVDAGKNRASGREQPPFCPSFGAFLFSQGSPRRCS